MMPAARCTQRRARSSLDRSASEGPAPAADRTVKPAAPDYGILGWPRMFDQEGYPASKAPWGTLSAIDLGTGRLVWTDVYHIAAERGAVIVAGREGALVVPAS